MNNQPQAEEHEEENETMDFSKPDYVFIPNGIHTWRQKGPYLECKECDIHHAVFIGIHKLMVGVGEKGQPILKKL